MVQLRTIGLAMLLAFAMSGAAQAQQAVTPEKDPRPERAAQLVPAVRGKHPRLLFTAEDIPALKKLAENEGAAFHKAFMDYLPVSRPPDDKSFLTNATDAQREGLWRLPTVALHYALTGDKTSFDRTVGYMKMLLELENWELGGEQDSGMGAANIMIGAALAYDWTYHELDPEFREAYRKKLLLHARRMYHRGHLNKGESIGYWQNDPQNNHRWHRNAGMTLCALAVAGDGPGDEWILSKTLEELEFVAKWLPDDGTSHEGPSYMVFGAGHLLLAFDAADRCYGTSFLDLPFFREIVSFRMQTLTPGLTGAFCFGDCGGTGSYANYLWLCAAHHKAKDLQAGVMEFFKRSPGSFWIGWWSLVWFDPTLTGGSIENLPKAKLFPDLGLAFVRDGWAENDVGVMLKSAPYGGFKLNQYRNENEFHYINVAHDDPDANMFVLYANGRMLARDDGYAYNKVTSSHNTILVNGKGQKGEGQHWTQPLKGEDADMTGLARVTTWKDAGDIVVAEGEAGGAYTDLDHCRRTLIWVKGRYVLLLDDIRAGQEAEITWLMQGAGLETVSERQSHYRLKSDEARCDFRVVADTRFVGRVAESTADHRGRPMDLEQLQLTANTARWRVAAVFDPWQRGDVRIEMTAQDDNAAVITVTGGGESDTWTWQAAPDNETPSTLRGEWRGGVVEVGPQDKAERP